MSEPPALPGVTHTYVDAAGLRTHVALAGPDSAPPLLLLHGWPQHWWEWRAVIPQLTATHRLIVPDLRGFGWTQAPPRGYEKEQLAADVLAVLDALGIERFTWVGHDWGGWVGWLAALRAPERIERLLVLCVPHPWGDPHPRQLALLGYQGPLSLPLLGRSIARRMVPLILQSGRGSDRLPDSDVRLFADHIPPAVSVAMYRTFLAREVLPVARGRYARRQLEMPSHLMVGAKDLVTRGLRAGPVGGQANLTVEVIGRVAHWIPEQRPELVVDWVRQAG